MKRVEPFLRPSGPGAGRTFDGIPGWLLFVISFVPDSASRGKIATSGGNTKESNKTCNWLASWFVKWSLTLCGTRTCVFNFGIFHFRFGFCQSTPCNDQSPMKEVSMTLIFQFSRCFYPSSININWIHYLDSKRCLTQIIYFTTFVWNIKYIKLFWKPLFLRKLPNYAIKKRVVKISGVKNR